MSTAAFMATATADCPVSDITVSGKTTAELEALDADIQAYSDGYFATVTMTNDGLFYANDITSAAVAAVAAVADDTDTAEDETVEEVTAVDAVDSNLVFAFGAGTISATDDDVSGTMGAYVIQVNQDNDYALTADADLLFFGGAKTIDTATTANYVAMTTDKYGATIPASASTWVEDAVMTVSFYMPEEATTEGTAETVTDVGDRLNTGDVVALWTGFETTGTVPVAACGSGATIVMGAATLAAGSAAFAAALAF